MQLASNELNQLSELIMSCVNSITSMGLFKNMVQDPELKSILETHLPVHIQDYNIKVEYVKNATTPTQKLNVPALKKTLQDFTKAPVNMTQPTTPNTNATTLNDREIATSYLLTLKRAGREYAWSAMEASNPDLREFLKDAFTMSCNHAYEVWQWMVKKGYYPLCPAPEEEITKIGNTYNEVTNQQ